MERRELIFLGACSLVTLKRAHPNQGGYWQVPDFHEMDTATETAELLLARMEAQEKARLEMAAKAAAALEAVKLLEQTLAEPASPESGNDSPEMA